MTKVSDIFEFIHDLAPFETAESWDNVGLLCGDMKAQVTGILLCMDVTMQVINKAIEEGKNLIISHHPLFLSSLKSITMGDLAGQKLIKLIKNNINVISAHTNLDLAAGGVNDVAAEKLGLKNVESLSEIARTGNLPVVQSFTDFVKILKDTFNVKQLRYNFPVERVKKIGFGGGSCGFLISDALAAGCDVFVSADIKYHQFLDASEMGMCVIDIGHFESEVQICDSLLQDLQKVFVNIKNIDIFNGDINKIRQL